MNGMRRLRAGLALCCAIGCLLTQEGVIAENTGQADMRIGLPVGAVAPDFSATTHQGTTVRLSELYANGRVVLIFYRGAWCPYCNRHLREFQQRLGEFQRRKTTLLAISVDKPDYALKTARDEGLGFEVISDPEANLLEQYRVLYRVPEEMAEQYRREYGIDLEKHSGRKDHVIAVPAAYGIDTNGSILFAYVSEDYTVRVTPDELLAVLDAAVE